MQIDATGLRTLELIYGVVVVFNERKQVMVCRHCRGERTLHREHCYYGALGRLIDELQHQEGAQDGEVAECR
jgi:hypothetical protein